MQTLGYTIQLKDCFSNYSEYHFFAMCINTYVIGKDGKRLSGRRKKIVVKEYYLSGPESPAESLFNLAKER